MITNLNKYKAIYEEKNNCTDLIIVDVQENFKRFFSNTYLIELRDYAEKFQLVHQIWDNIDADNESYYFPNQVNSFEKAYGGELTRDEVDYYFYDERTKEAIYNGFDNGFESGAKFETNHGDYWIYIGSYHEWFYCSKEIADFAKKLADNKRKVCLVGGADQECLYDTYITLQAFDVDVEYNYDYIYSASHNPYEEQDSDIELDKYLREIEVEETNEEKSTEYTSIEKSKLAELDKDKDEEGNIIVYEEIPDDMYIDSIIDIFTNAEDLMESHGKYIKTLDMTHRTVDRNDIVWMTCYLKPRNKSVAYPIGEIGVIQCKVLRTFYGLNKLKQLKMTDKIIG